MIFIFLEIKSPSEYCYMGLPGLKWSYLYIRVKIPKQSQNQNHFPFLASLFENAFFLVRMCHTLYVKVSPSMVLRPKGEKRPLFSIFPSAWPFGSYYWRGLEQEWRFRVRRKMAAFFASSVAQLLLPRLCCLLC